MTIVEQIDWFRVRWEEPPERLHKHEVWADETGGSALGAPAFSDGFRRWLEGSPEATLHEEQVGLPCLRLTARERHSPNCPACDGTGLRTVSRRRYRYPMRAALARLSRQPVPKGRPSFDKVLWQLALNDFSVARTSDAMRWVWPYMGDPIAAWVWVESALIRLRLVYREGPPSAAQDALRRRKSDAQLDAEAATTPDLTAA